MQSLSCVQGRISNLAAGFRVDFGALHQNDARALHELLIRQVYPDQPDFSALDAIDDALTQLDEVGVSQAIPIPNTFSAYSSLIYPALSSSVFNLLLSSEARGARMIRLRRRL